MVTIRKKNTSPHNQWEVGSLAINGQDPLHEYILRQRLQEFIELEAGHHDAVFDPNAFKKVIRRIEKGTAFAYVIAVNTPTGDKELAGCIIEFPTVKTIWDGGKFVQYPAIYGEDFLITKDTSKRFKEQTHSQSLGTVALIEKMRSSINNRQGIFPSHMTPFSMIMEYGRDNKPIEKLFQRLGSVFDPQKGNTVLYFDKKTPCPRSRTNGIQVEIRAFFTHPLSF